MSQKPVTLRCPIFEGYEGWGESDPDECVDALKKVRNGILPPVHAAATFARENFGWHAQAKKLHAMLKEYDAR